MKNLLIKNKHNILKQHYENSSIVIHGNVGFIVDLQKDNSVSAVY